MRLQKLAPMYIIEACPSRNNNEKKIWGAVYSVHLSYYRIIQTMFTAAPM